MVYIYYALYIKKEVYIELKNTKKIKLFLEFNENNEKLKKFALLKNIDTQKKLTSFMRTKYCKDVLGVDLPSLKKYNSFFDGKISIPGLYVYRLSYDFFNVLMDRLNIKK